MRAASFCRGRAAVARTAVSRALPAARTARVSRPAASVYRAGALALRGLASSASTAESKDLPLPLANLNSRVLDNKNMKKILGAELFEKFDKARNPHTDVYLSKEDKNQIALAVRKWAQSFGCAGYSHWFFPMRGAVAGDKVETFLQMDFKSFEAEVGFSGSELFQTETDGSSFPNGGLRDTHAAAAYMIWDMQSPLFIYNDLLYIPCAFVSWRGEGLDYKTPLARSSAAVDREFLRLLRHLGDEESEGVWPFLGWEQEFFLVDHELYHKRPDLVACGRTLFGNTPLNGQENSDNYFASMPSRVRDLLLDVRDQLLEIGVNVKVAHNEVAPGQHEITPIFSLAQHGADSNIAAMKVLEETCLTHGLTVLYHEKPFAGINGSGKHANVSFMTTNTEYNLCAPGKTADSQVRFMAFVAALARAIHLHGDLLRMGVSTAGNDHRLGAQEAPPAIFSLYLGESLEDFVRAAAEGGPLTGYGDEDKDLIVSDGFPKIKANLEDRNRTAPFPWVGNRFELRAVGSDQNCAWPIVMVNTAVAEAVRHMNEQVESGKDAETVIRETLKAHAGVLFHGDGYDVDLVTKLAADNNLHQLPTSPDAYDEFASEKNRKLFSDLKIFSDREVTARQEVARATFVNTISIEGRTALHMLRTGIIPACFRDIQTESQVALANNPALSKKKALLEKLITQTEALDEIMASLPEDSREAARYCVDRIRPALEETRTTADSLEDRIAKDLWPYPSYGELVYSHH